MTIKIEDLSTLDPDLVEQELAFTRQLVQEDNPQIDAKFGPLHNMLLYYGGGVLGTRNQTEMSRLQQSMSLQAISVDPTLADDEGVDNIASNFLLTRAAGTQAGGSVTIIVDQLAAVTIAGGAIFEADGKRFVTTQSFSARTAESLVTSDSDRVLNPVGDGTYSFTVDVEAEDEGESSQISKNTLCVPVVQPTGFVKAYATSDFTGGHNEESNAELIAAIVPSISAKTLSGREHMSAAVRAIEEFADIVADSIIGLGDEEMLRDQHSIFPGSMGGRTDWYVRTQARAQRTGLTVTATLMEKTVSGRGIWQFALGRDEVPGFYDVINIVPQGADSTVGGYAIDEDIRQLDLTAIDNDGFLPDIATVEEGVYSRFQAGIIRFIDSDTVTTDLTVGESEQDYDITVRSMPLIADIHDYVATRRVRNPAGDVLVKAPVPCFLKVSFSIHLRPGQVEPDTDAIKDDLASLVNLYGFTGRLPASALSDVIHNHLEGVAALSAIDMFGQVRKPDGVLRTVRSTEILEVPNEPDSMVSARTVAFLLDIDDIAISVVEVDIPEI